MDNAGATLTIQGDFDNSQNGGFVQTEGEVVMDGTVQQTIRGINTFKSIGISNPAGVVTTATNTITALLDFDGAGTLFIGDNDLILNSAIISDEDADSYVQTNAGVSGGNLVRNVGVCEVLFPVGTSTYTPVVVGNGGGTDYSVRVFNQVREGGTTGPVYTQQAVNRTWYIAPDFAQQQYYY